MSVELGTLVSVMYLAKRDGVKNVRVELGGYSGEPQARVTVTGTDPDLGCTFVGKLDDAPMTVGRAVAAWNELSGFDLPDEESDDD